MRGGLQRIYKQRKTIEEADYHHGRPRCGSTSHTAGMWDKTQPVEVALVKGRNVLRFSRAIPVKGLTIKDFNFKSLK